MLTNRATEPSAGRLQCCVPDGFCCTDSQPPDTNRYTSLCFAMNIVLISKIWPRFRTLFKRLSANQRGRLLLFGSPANRRNPSAQTSAHLFTSSLSLFQINTLCFVLSFLHSWKRLFPQARGQTDLQRDPECELIHKSSRREFNHIPYLYLYLYLKYCCLCMEMEASISHSRPEWM